MTTERTHERRVGLEDDIPKMLHKMSNGNPGAVSVMMKMMYESENPFKGVMNILELDELGIYAELIWVSYKDICGEDIKVFMDKVKSREIVPLLDEWKTKHGYDSQ